MTSPADGPTDGQTGGTVRPRLDHLVIGTVELDAGTAALARTSGLALPEGGRHPLMGTHNRLTRLGPAGESAAFLELIAIDPTGAAPARPRWYGLDGRRVRSRLIGGPALLTWVVAVDDLDAALASAASAGVDAGRPLEQARADLRWRIGVRDDGELVEGGAFPTLIEWPPGTDATARMSDIGVRLTSLRARHPEPARLAAALRAIGAEALVALSAGEPGLAATLAHGERAIEL